MSVLLSFESLTKAYGHRPLFSDLTMDLREQARVGLIGPNGSGKSTLLKILTGLETPDAGTVSRRRGGRFAYVAQEALFDLDATIEDIVFAGLADVDLEDYERWTQVGIVLGKVGIDNPQQCFGTLSGGWRKRVAIARELVRDPDLLLLDEPTNHLDLEGVLWLEALLKEASFGFVLVSHDRYFLENVATEVIELNRTYPEGYFRVEGNYSVFLERREEFLSGQAQQERSLASRARREIEWLQRGARARTGKSVARIEEAGRLLDELAEVKSRNAQANKVQIDFSSTGRRSRKLLTADRLAKQMGDRLLFHDLSFTLSPGSKLGLLGSNGSGKSTLLKLLTGELTQDQGTIVRIDGLRVVAFDQNRAQLDRTITLRRTLAPNTDTLLYQGKPFHVIAWAKRFLFKVEQLDLLVGDLSGGEQARILIARLMLQEADVLLLDEPTNDLDIPSLEVLEESLAEFPGALVLVTHDRYLLDRLCTEIVGLDGRGNARIFADYSQWLTAQEEPKPEAKERPALVKKGRERPKKLSYREQREWEQMEAAIEAGEKTVHEWEQRVGQAAGDHVRLQEACHALQEARDAVQKLYDRWAELEAKQG